MEKRKLVTLTLKSKIDLISTAEMNPSKKRKEIAEEFGIAPTTVTGILKDKEKYKQQYFSGQIDVNKSRVRPARFNAVDDALLQWFTHARSSNIPVTGPAMKAKAEDISHQLGIYDWSCSEGWLHRFKKRHNISYKVISGERGAVDEEKTDAWIEDVLKPTLSKYDSKDIFNADKTGLFWRLLPDKTLASKSEKCFGGKKSKDRITVMVCANMNGTEKYPLFTIGKFRNPRCFKGITLPVQYSANPKAWMTLDLFKDWLRGFDSSMASQHRKVLLVIDNCPAHPRIHNLKATQLLFLPPHATSKLQPCNLGIIRSMNVNYRKISLMKLIRHIDTGAAYEDFKLTLLDAVSMVKYAWEEVTSTTISNCFIKAGFTDNKASYTPEKDDNLTNEPLLERLFREYNISSSDYVSVDDNIPATAPAETAFAPSSTSSATTTQEAESDEDDCGDPEETIIRAVALACLHKLQLRLMQTECSNAVQAPFHHFRKTFERHLINTRTQTTMTQFLFRAQRQQPETEHPQEQTQDRETQEERQDGQTQEQTQERQPDGQTKEERQTDGRTQDGQTQEQTREERQPDGHTQDKQTQDRQTQEERQPGGRTQEQTQEKRQPDGQTQEERQDGQTQEKRQDGQTEEERQDGQTQEERQDGQTQEKRQDGQTEEERQDGQTQERQSDRQTQEERQPDGQTQEERQDGQTDTGGETGWTDTGGETGWTDRGGETGWTDTGGETGWTDTGGETGWTDTGEETGWTDTGGETGWTDTGGETGWTDTGGETGWTDTGGETGWTDTGETVRQTDTGGETGWTDTGETVRQTDTGGETGWTDTGETVRQTDTGGETAGRTDTGRTKTDTGQTEAGGETDTGWTYTGETVGRTDTGWTETDTGRTETGGETGRTDT